MKLVNKGKAIEYNGMVYSYKSVSDAQKVMNDIETVSKFCDVNVKKVLFDTCIEISDSYICNF